MRLDRVWLRYRYRGPWILRDVELELGPGRSAVVLGHEGVGKSTLLQLVAGVLRPTRGTVRDRPATIGWVPERFPADQPHTVHRYLTAMGSIRGLSGSDLVATVDDWMERLDLEPYRDVRLSALPRETAQKVGLAQALLQPPDLLILDEPWEGFDEATRELIPELIEEVREDGGAVLVSDHRGETDRLPDAEQWTIADGLVSVVFPTAAEGAEAEGVSVIELAVPTFRVAGVVADLRAAGHQVLRVRSVDPSAETTRPAAEAVETEETPTVGSADAAAGAPGEVPAGTTGRAAAAGSAPAVGATSPTHAVPAGSAGARGVDPGAAGSGAPGTAGESAPRAGGPARAGTPAGPTGADATTPPGPSSVTGAAPGAGVASRAGG